MDDSRKQVGDAVQACPKIDLVFTVILLWREVLHVRGAHSLSAKEGPKFVQVVDA